MLEFQKIGIIVKYYRKSLKISQNELCKEVMDRKTLYRIEEGIAECSVDYVKYLLSNLGLDGISSYNEGIVTKNIDLLYESVLDFNDEYSLQLIDELLSLHSDNCILSEYKEILSTLRNSYASNIYLPLADINKYLVLLGIYPTKLQILILNYVYYCLVKNENLRTIDRINEKYVLFREDELLRLNRINYLISKKKPLEAYDECHHGLEWCLANNKYDRALCIYQRIYQIYLNVQPQNCERVKKEMLNFAKEHKSKLNTKRTANIYYQMGVNLLINRKYGEAIHYFENCYISLTDSIRLINCLNYCYLKSNIDKFIEYDITSLGIEYTDKQLYKYLHLKKKMSNNYDYNVLYSAFSKMIDGYKFQEYNVKYYLYLYEAKEIDAALNNHNLLYKRVKI